LPVSLLLPAVEQIVILASYPSWGRWMIPLLTIPCILAAGVLISARLPVRLPDKVKVARFLLPTLAVGLVALMFAPTVWAALPILRGTESDMAGPALQENGASPPVQGASGPITANSGPQGGRLVAGTGSQEAADPALVRYLEEHQGQTQVLVVTDSNADGLILATNKPVMPLNGFSSYPLTANEAASLVASGTVRFFLLSGGGGAPSGTVTSWVAQHCATVPPSLWQSSPSSAQTGGEVVPGVSPQLYDCATPRVTPHR
jgi:hypothetical protein